MSAMEDKGKLRAAALKYDADTDNAPCIVGLGEGYVAQKMLETAAEENIAVVEDQSLAGILSKLSVGDEIPEELYEVIAQVLVFIARMDRQSSEHYKLEDIRKGKRR